MRVALILPGNIWFAPYVRIYTRLLEAKLIDYSIISWNRDGRDPAEGFQYKGHSFDGTRSASLSEYLHYVQFIRRTVSRERFDRLIVFGPQISCLLFSLLIRWKGKYIIDYRDLSIEQKPGLKQLFSLLVKWSFANVISSPGFSRCLPKADYLISHNFNVDVVKEALGGQNYSSNFHVDDEIDVLTIGGIRDYSSNIEIVKSLANKKGFSCRFVGKGLAENEIRNYCDNNGIKNVHFSGFYRKEEEPGFIISSTFMNIYYPRIITHDTAMSNRFYNSLIYKRPMIVTQDTTQGDYVVKYGLGVAIKDGTGLAEKIQAFLETDYSEYCRRCNDLLRLFMIDQHSFEKMVNSFIES